MLGLAPGSAFGTLLSVGCATLLVGCASLLLVGCATPAPTTSLPRYSSPAAEPTTASSPSAVVGSAQGAQQAGPSALPSEALASLSSVAPGAPSPLVNNGPVQVLVPGPTPWTTLPTLRTGPHKGLNQGVVLASSVAASAQEKAMVSLAVRYFEFTMRTQLDPTTRLDSKTLAGLAQGAPASALAKYVASLRTKKAQTVGWMSVNVTQIVSEVGGADPEQRSGLLSLCIDNGSFDARTSDGQALETAEPAYQSLLGAQLTPKGWRVTSWTSTVRTSRCPQP